MNVSSPLDPIDALAAHFQSSGRRSTEKHGTLQVPSLLRKNLKEKLNPPEGPAGKVFFAAEEVKKLVRSISEEDYERWCLLDDTAFTFVTKILLEAAPCLAKDQGLFRMIVSGLFLEALETLNDENSDLAMPKELLVDYKGAVGDSLVVKLLTCFVETKESDLSRRWIGLLLVELLGDSEINRERIWEMPEETLKNVGEIIISGADRMLKIVAGKIIWQMMLGFGDKGEIRHRLAAFCQSSEASDFTKDFPLQDGSQWENGFVSFITDMEEERYDLDIGLPTGYNGYQVKIGEDNPINTEFGVISISIAEIFSIYIPPDRDRSPDWVDFKIVNISKIESTNQGVTGDAMKDFTYFKLHLCDYEEDGYLYLLSMRPSSYSDNVMVLCYKTDADDFAEDVKRCKSKVLRRMSNRSAMSSAPVKDIQANPARHQSQQAKLDELERHRDDILKVLESSGRSRSSPKSATDLDGGGDGLGLPVNGGGKSRGSEEEKTQSADLTEVEGESNGSSFRDSSQNFRSSLAPRQQRLVPHLAASEPIQDTVETPDNASGGIAGASILGPLVPYTTRDLLDDTFEIASRNQPRYLRSSVRVQRATEIPEGLIESGSELTDVTDVPEEQQLELLFRDMPARRVSKKPVKQIGKPQKKHKVASSKVVRPLEFPVKGNAPAVRLEGNLARDSAIALSARGLSHTPAQEQPLNTVEKTEKIPKPAIRNEILFKKHRSAAVSIAKNPETLPGVVVSTEGNLELEEKPGRATRNLPELSDEVSVIETPANPRDSSGRDSKPNIFGSLDAPAKGRVVKSIAKIGRKSRLLAPGGPVPLENLVGESRIEREDMLKKKTETTASKITEDSHGLPVTLGHTAPKDDPKKKPRPAIPNLTWLLDDITPPSTYADKQMVRQRGKLKDRLVGRTGQSEKKQGNAQVAVAAFDPTLVPRPTVVSLMESKLVSPEDTSIWDLPDSEDPGREDNPPSKNGKGKGNAKPKKQASNTKSSKAKQKTGPKKRVYAKKSAIIANPKPNELVLDSDEGLESVGEKLPVHVPVRNLRPKQDSSKPAATKRVAVQEKEEEIVPVGISKRRAVRKAAPAQMPTKSIAAQDSSDDMGLTEGDKLATLNLSSKSEFTSISVPTRRGVADQGEDNGFSLGEKQSPPIRPPKLKAARGAAHTSAPAKRMTDWDRLSGSDNEKEGSGPPKKRKKMEQAKVSEVKTVSRPSRPVAKKAPAALKKNPKFDIFQNTSQADENSSWRPKTRLQAKMELAAKAMNLTKETDNLGNRSIRGSSEKSQGTSSSETSSSDESLGGSKDTSSPIARSKVQRIPGNSGVLSTGVNDLETTKRNPLLGTEVSVEVPTEIHQQGTGAKRTEASRKGKFHSMQNLALEVPARPNTRNHVKWTAAKPEDTTNSHVNSGSEHIGMILGGSPKSNDGSRVTGITDPIRLTKQSENISKFSSQEWLVISDDETKTPSIAQNNKNSPPESLIEVGVQLYDDIEMSEEFFENQKVEDSQAERLQEQKLPPITGNQERARYQAPTAIMNPVATSSPLVDANSIPFLNSSRDPTSPKKKNLKPVLPSVTPKGLNTHSKIPSATGDALIDDHLARKAQIISWDNEGPKNQGRTPAAEQRSPYPGGWLGQAEYSIKNKALRDPGHPLSPDASANKDEDRIMRRRESSSFSIYLTGRSIEAAAVENESPSPVTTTQAQAEIVESSEIESDLEESNSEDEIHLPLRDVGDNIAEANQESLESTKQESELPMPIKRIEGSSHPFHIDPRDTSSINADLKVGEVSNKEAKRDFSANPLEEAAVLNKSRELAIMDGEAPRAHRRDRVSREISIIEISESSPDETEAEETRQNEIIELPIVRTRMPSSLLPKNKPVSINSLPLPISIERLLTPNNIPSLIPNESLAFQSFPLGVKDIPSTLDVNNHFTTRGSGNRQTTFFKWLQKTDFKRSRNDSRNGRVTHQELSKNLQLEDPDKTLVNEDDFKDAEMSRSGNFEKVPTREQKRGRDPSTTDSDDSSDFSTDFDNSPDEEEEEEEEGSSEEDENPQLVWRRSIPDHHGETLSVLDQISQKLLRYLMSGEELAWEVIKDFEKQGNEIVNQLGESHEREYEEFLVKVKTAKQRMQKEHGAIIKVVESDIAKLQEEKVALANLRAKTNDTYNNLDGTIATLMAQLEEELGVATHTL